MFRKSCGGSRSGSKINNLDPLDLVTKDPSGSRLGTPDITGNETVATF